MKTSLLGAFASLLMCFSASSKAAVVHWDLVDAVLEDGQTVTGGFDYDRDINTYSNISVTTSGSAILPSEIYTGFVDGAQGGITLHDGTPAVNDIVLDVKWGLNGEELTNAGGTVSLNVPWVAFYHCALPDCSSRSQSSTSPTYIHYISGSLTAVPIPPALYLFGTGLIGLVGAARKNRNLRQKG